MPWKNVRKNALMPDAWDASWTARRARWTVLNQKQNAWHADQLPPPMALRAPFGEGDSGWNNPCTTHTVPLTFTIATQQAILTANPKRNLLVVQNNATATSPDAAPSLYVAFGQLASVGQSMQLPPGVGIVLDIVCPRDAVYLIWGPATNGGGTVNWAGVVVEGALSPT